MSYASSHMHYKQRMIKNTKTFLMPTLDHLVQEVQEWQLSQEGKIKRREDVHQEGHFVMTSQKTYQ